MLIKCPRCGFQQPQDKYCAQCGVDMETYKPAAPSFFKRFFGSPLVQLSLLLFIATVTGLFIFKQGQRQVTGQRSNPRSSVQINTSSTSRLPPTNANVDDSEEAASQSIEENGAAEATHNLNTTTSPTPTNPSPPPTKSGPKLIIYYTEVTKNALQRIFEDSQSTGQFMSFGDYTAGILPGVERRVTPSNVSIKILHREERSIDKDHPVRWFYGKGETGLETLIEPIELDRDSFRANLEIRRSWVELGPNQNMEPTRKSFPAIFEVGTGTGFFMSGVIPRKTPLDQENELTAMDVYKILRSPSFQKGESEFVIFIEFEKNN